MFVGTYALDSLGFYEKSPEYRYMCQGIENLADSPQSQFTVDRKNKKLTINTPLAPRTLFLGVLSGDPQDYFGLPVYPVESVVRVFVDRGIGNNAVPSTLFTFDREQVTLITKAPTGAGVSITAGLVGD